MKNERILSYKMSRKISADELQSVSAAGMTSYYTANASHSGGSWDGAIDVTIDM